MSIIVQQITITWGKESRGGKAAAERNAVPTKVPLPEIPAEEAIYAHAIGLGHGANPSEQHSSPIRTLAPKFLRDYGLEIESEDDVLVLHSYFGKHTGDRQFTIKPNNWIQLEHVKAELVGFDHIKQWTRTLLNIIYADSSRANEILMRQEPQYTERA